MRGKSITNSPHSHLLLKVIGKKPYLDHTLTVTKFIFKFKMINTQHTINLRMINLFHTCDVSEVRMEVWKHYFFIKSESNDIIMMVVAGVKKKSLQAQNVAKIRKYNHLSIAAESFSRTEMSKKQISSVRS